MKEKTEKNPKGAGASEKPNKKIQYSGGRIEANLFRRWKLITKNKVFHLEKAMTDYLNSLPILPEISTEERDSLLS